MKQLVEFIRSYYGSADFIPLHAPTFTGNELRYVTETIASTFVSSVGAFVERIEQMICGYTAARHAVATVNGSAALHTALLLVGVEPGDLVITQPLTFVATANAIRYCGAVPLFVDVDRETAGLSADATERFLRDGCLRDAGGVLRRRADGKRVAAVVPMHSYGFPVRIEELARLCSAWGLPLVEDAAESLGSFVGPTHTGRFGALGVFSFNGNKTITTGGGGMILTDDPQLGTRAKHLTTTAKLPHQWEFVHDEVGFNYRMPNINAALGCAQLEQLDVRLQAKRHLAHAYLEFFSSAAWRDAGYTMLTERPGTTANFWLNSLLCPDRQSRDELLRYTNANGVMTRPTWELMYRIPAHRDGLNAGCPVAEDLSDRLVNLPSSPLMETA